MAKERLTDKTAHSSLDNADLLHIVDVSDTTSNDAGTSKKTLLSVLYAWIKAQIDTDFGDYVLRWPTWGEVTGKPSTFTPAAHTHTPGTRLNSSKAVTGISGVYTMDFENDKNVFSLTVNGDISELGIQDVPDGNVIIVITQDATGRAVTLSSDFVPEFGSNDEVIDTTPNAVINLLCWYDNALNKIYIIKNIVE